MPINLENAVLDNFLSSRIIITLSITVVETLLSSDTNILVVLIRLSSPVIKKAKV